MWRIGVTFDDVGGQAALAVVEQRTGEHVVRAVVLSPNDSVMRRLGHFILEVTRRSGQVAVEVVASDHWAKLRTVPHAVVCKAVTGVGYFSDQVEAGSIRPGGDLPAMEAGVSNIAPALPAHFGQADLDGALRTDVSRQALRLACAIAEPAVEDQVSTWHLRW